MNLIFDLTGTTGYTSKSQIARILTERWVNENIYCPSCGNTNLSKFTNNLPVADFFCNSCNAEYELKSKKDSSSLKIAGGSYSAMIQRINADNNPNFFFLDYDSKTLSVKNFFVIPKYYFTDDVIKERKPLGSGARRAGWVGCNIHLDGVPDSGKIYYIKNESVLAKELVLESWQKTKFLSNQKGISRGWTIEIMKVLDRIPKVRFSLNDVYSFQEELQSKFPGNNFVKDKIRQQLQVLRDRSLLEFEGRGMYRKI